MYNDFLKRSEERGWLREWGARGHNSQPLLGNEPALTPEVRLGRIEDGTQKTAEIELKKRALGKKIKFFLKTRFFNFYTLTFLCIFPIRFSMHFLRC